MTASRTASSAFVMQERVRWADVDLVGIMRFSAFTRLLELGEQELMRAAGLPFSLVFDRPELLMPRRALAFEYFAPARIDDLLTLRTFVSRMGETSMTISQEVLIAESVTSGTGTRVATATMTVVCVSAAEFAKQPLPAIVRERLGGFVLRA
ncbi:MAG TPA: thioesterase family protein [Gemmatimonas sp.]|nr:thioesterase family protein [Gemmatimonas sp.]